MFYVLQSAKNAIHNKFTNTEPRIYCADVYYDVPLSQWKNHARVVLAENTRSLTQRKADQHDDAPVKILWGKSDRKAPITLRDQVTNVLATLSNPKEVDGLLFDQFLPSVLDDILACCQSPMVPHAVGGWAVVKSYATNFRERFTDCFLARESDTAKEETVPPQLLKLVGAHLHCELNPSKEKTVKASVAAFATIADIAELSIPLTMCLSQGIRSFSSTHDRCLGVSFLTDVVRRSHERVFETAKNLSTGTSPQFCTFADRVSSVLPLFYADSRSETHVQADLIMHGLFDIARKIGATGNLLRIWEHFAKNCMDTSVRVAFEEATTRAMQNVLKPTKMFEESRVVGRWNMWETLTLINPDAHIETDKTWLMSVMRGGKWKAYYKPEVFSKDGQYYAEHWMWSETLQRKVKQQFVLPQPSSVVRLWNKVVHGTGILSLFFLLLGVIAIIWSEVCGEGSTEYM